MTNTRRKVYLICPVRNVTEQESKELRDYVGDLEMEGYEVHFPPRDVDQSNDDGGIRIVQAHMEAMMKCDEVHVYWNGVSGGSHFDLGAAYMLNLCRSERGLPPLIIRTVNGIHYVMEKSFQNVAVHMAVTSSLWIDEEGVDLPPFPGELGKDSQNGFLEQLEHIAGCDASGLRKAAQSYGNSWKSRGGIGAYMMLARKWDRMENRVRRLGWDIFRAIATDQRGEGVIDDVRDLRRYLMLVEAEMVARGFDRLHRDNKANA
jgi:hypothetical protein